jgi:hypothetical protein
MNHSLRMIAGALGGQVIGREVLAPGPNHSRKDRSLAISLSHTLPCGFVVYSHAGDDPLICRDYVARRLGIEKLTGEGSSHSVPLSKSSVEENGKRRDWARRVWDEGLEPRSTLVERYLASRRIVLSDDISGPVLRFHPRCPWRDDSGALLRVPALLALYRGIMSDEIVGIQRTRLSPNGAKIERRMLGNCRDGAIKFDADENVTIGLTIGEGAETVATARQHDLRPAWALGSVGAIARFPVLAGVESLTLLAEIGTASARAVDECGACWHAKNREVIVVRSRLGSDLNDAVRELAA